MPTLKEMLKNKLTAKELALLPNSFDTIGNIAIFTSFPNELKKKERLIAETLLKSNKNLKTIAKKTQQYSGKYRLQKIKIIAGEKSKETLHKENGLQFKLDVEKCYFSPRTASERIRIVRLINPQESVLVMFSGIGAFPLTIAKYSRAKEIYGIEINPAAHKYALENKRLNGCNNVTLLKGDVKKIMPKVKKRFDRIIMPLPKDASQYLSLALKHLNKKGIIHFYDFSQEKDFPKASIEKIKKHLKKFKILQAVKCGQYSPYTFRVCIDFQHL